MEKELFHGKIRKNLQIIETLRKIKIIKTKNVGVSILLDSIIVLFWIYKYFSFSKVKQKCVRMFFWSFKNTKNSIRKKVQVAIITCLGGGGTMGYIGDLVGGNCSLFPLYIF